MVDAVNYSSSPSPKIEENRAKSPPYQNFEHLKYRENSYYSGYDGMNSTKRSGNRKFANKIIDSPKEINKYDFFFNN